MIRSDLSDAFATGDDFTIVSAVRAWAYERIDRAGDEALTLDMDYSKAWVDRGWVDLFNALENDEGGFYCGGTAIMLSEIYRALGYEATVFNFGAPENAATHVITLVRIQTEDRAVLSIQDAYFGYTILKDDAPAHFGDLIAAVDAGDLTGFSIDENEGCKPLLTQSAALRDYVGQYYSVFDLDGRSEHVAFCHDFTLSDFLAHDPQSVGFLDAAEAKGYPRNVFYLMRYQLGIDHTGLVDAAIDGVF